MSNKANSDRNRIEVPDAKEAMKRFKMEVAGHKVTVQYIAGIVV